MAIVSVTPPQASIKELQRALKEISETTFFTARNQVRKRQTMTLEESPLAYQVFFVGLNDLVSGAGLENARLVSWLYFVKVGSSLPAMAAEVNVDMNQQVHTFSQLCTDKDSGDTANVFHEADKIPVVANGKFEERLLRIPALHISALWLRSELPGKDVFILLPRVPDFLEKNKMYFTDEFLSKLRDSAKAKIAKSAALDLG
ncbi:MAG TPA: hypothetical protein VFF39_13275 [Verrucomicrobiae bacterium]|nr:hypothetical protein [Verrucomicrobiae bacterium]